MNKIITKMAEYCRSIPDELLILVARVAIATVFWRSAQTKFSGWDFLGQHWQVYNLSQSTFMLFDYEYDLPIIPPDVAAYLATFAEFSLSIAIVLGLLTRLSALALLGMTAVIQIFVYPDAWPTHSLWAVGLLLLLKNGGGTISLDRLLFKR